MGSTEVRTIEPYLLFMAISFALFCALYTSSVITFSSIALRLLVVYVPVRSAP